MRKYAYIFMGLFFLPLLAFPQGEIDEQEKVFYRDERSFGLLLHTSGYGISYRYGKRINYADKRLYEVGGYIYRDLKEVKITNPYWPNNRSFVFGKLNSLSYLNFGYGFQREIFRKFDVGGVAIRYFFTGGPSLALYKPIYYDVLYPVSLRDYVIRTEKFNESLHQSSDIFGRAGFFKGLDETKLVPGIFGKAGFNFEYSRYDRVLHSVEIGGMFHAFARKIPVMANDKKTQLIPALYISYRFGKVIDTMAPQEKRRRRPEPYPPPEIMY